MSKTKKHENKFIKGLKFTAKWAYKICIAAAGGLAIYSNPVTGTIAGAVAISSMLSASFKDKNIKPAMKLINFIACNIDKASNDPKINK